MRGLKTVESPVPFRKRKGLCVREMREGKKAERLEKLRRFVLARERIDLTKRIQGGGEVGLSWKHAKLT